MKKLFSSVRESCLKNFIPKFPEDFKSACSFALRFIADVELSESDDVRSHPTNARVNKNNMINKDPEMIIFKFILTPDG